jgi:hypothetical protein
MTKAADLSALGSKVTTAGNLSSNSTLTLQTNSTTAVTIDTSQNVGIGTATPYGSAKLSVSGSITATSGWTGTNSSAGKLGGIPMSFSCERSGTGVVTNVMSYGNGVTNGKGLRMPFAGKLVAATLVGYTITGTITLQAYLNGTANASYELTATGTASDIGQTQDFSASPLSFAANDTLGWYQSAVPTIANGYMVNYYVIYD